MGVIDDLFDGLSQLIDGIIDSVGAILIGFIVWFIIQLLLDAVFPQLAALIDFGFVLFTIYGVMQDADDTLKAASVVGVIIGIFSLVFSLWLIANIH